MRSLYMGPRRLPKKREDSKPPEGAAFLGTMLLMTMAMGSRIRHNISLWKLGLI